jgi:Mor family transcriptional regulator
VSEELPPELPPSVRELAEAIGLVAALKLVEKFGGITFYIPSEVDEEHDLAKLIGVEPARKLIKRFGSGHFQMPKCALLQLPERQRRERNKQIRAEHAAGVSASKLARKYGLTIRQVWYVFKEQPQDSPQLSLF